MKISFMRRSLDLEDSGSTLQQPNGSIKLIKNNNIKKFKHEKYKLLILIFALTLSKDQLHFSLG